MKRLIKKGIGYLLKPQPVPVNPFENISYGQEGEDLILERIFAGRPAGFFVDIGAHHPLRFSNTYLFYKKGWRGINIDPNPDSKKLFDAERPGDINLELGVSNQQGALQYYNFKEKALNTFSAALAKQYTDANWELENVMNIDTLPLADLLNKHLPANQKIDFMSIDVEGFEQEVLSSNDWTKYKPEVILVEMLDCPMATLHETGIAQFLLARGYALFAKTFNTVFFKLS